MRLKTSSISLVLRVLTLSACGQTATSGDDTAPDAVEQSDAPALENWLLAIGNGPDTGSGSTHALAQISILSGEVGAIHGVICPDLVFAGPDVANDVVSGLTFHDGILYAVGATGGATSKPAAALYKIDPCQCTATKVGDFGADFGLVGSVAGYPGHGLYGIASTSNSIFTVDPSTGAGTLVNTLPFMYGASGLSWSGPTRDTLWGIESNTDSLYELTAQGEYASAPLMLDYDFQGLGMEYHPGVQKLFACSQNHILEVNTTTGHVDVGTAFTWDGGCANLAAPYGPVACVPSIL